MRARCLVSRTFIAALRVTVKGERRGEGGRAPERITHLCLHGEVPWKWLVHRRKPSCATFRPPRVYENPETSLIRPWTSSFMRSFFTHRYRSLACFSLSGTLMGRLSVRISAASMASCENSQLPSLNLACVAACPAMHTFYQTTPGA